MKLIKRKVNSALHKIKRTEIFHCISINNDKMKLCDRDLVFRIFIDLLSSCSNTAGNPDFANYPENPAPISNPFRSRQTSIASGTSIFSSPKGRQERTYAYTCVCTYIAYVQNDKYRRRAFAHRSRPFSEERDKLRAT